MAWYGDFFIRINIQKNKMKIILEEKMKRRLSILLIAMMMLVLGACTQSRSEEELIIGMEADYAPYNWTQKDDSNGAIPIQGSNEFANGYDVQIAKRVAEALGKKPVAAKIAWEGLLPAVNSGKIDIIMAGMSPTAERAKEIDFSAAYYKPQLVLVVKEDGQYANATSLADFKGAKVVGQVSTVHDEVIDQIEGVEHLQALKDFKIMRISVQTGKADAYVAELPEAESAQAAGLGLKMIELTDGFETNPEDTDIAAGLKKGNEILDKVSEAIKAISEEERNQIMKDMQDAAAEVQE